MSVARASGNRWNAQEKRRAHIGLRCFNGVSRSSCSCYPVAIASIYWVLPILLTAGGVEWGLLLDRLPDLESNAAREFDLKEALKT